MARVRAGVFVGGGRCELRELPRPEPPPGGALLRVEACGLCASDLAQLHGLSGFGSGLLPLIPGHEIAGRIEALGRGSQALGVREGERVALNELRRCGECSGCRAGAVCQRLHVYGYTPLATAPGLWGGYGELIALLPNTQLFPVRSAISAEDLTLFEPLGNALHWIELAGVHPGQTVVVVGPGHQGLCVVAALRIAGAEPVIATGTRHDALRLAAARTLGAVASIDVEAEDPVERVRALTAGQMADVAFDVATSPASVTQALGLVRPGGRVLLAGYKHAGAGVSIDTDSMLDRGVSLIAGMGSTPQTMATAVRLLDEGRIDTATLRGELFSLDQLDTALALLERKLPGRDAARFVLRHGG